MSANRITIDRIEASPDKGGPLSFYIRVPDDAPREKIEAAIVALVQSLDALYREVGGDGLTLEAVRLLKPNADDTEPAKEPAP